LNRAESIQVKQLFARQFIALTTAAMSRYLVSASYLLIRGILPAFRKSFR
jgi:hypothetical protein